MTTPSSLSHSPTVTRIACHTASLYALLSAREEVELQYDPDSEKKSARSWEELSEPVDDAPLDRLGREEPGTRRKLEPRRLRVEPDEALLPACVRRLLVVEDEDEGPRDRAAPAVARLKADIDSRRREAASSVEEVVDRELVGVLEPDCRDVITPTQPYVTSMNGTALTDKAAALADGMIVIEEISAAEGGTRNPRTDARYATRLLHRIGLVQSQGAKIAKHRLSPIHFKLRPYPATQRGTCFW